MAKRIALFNHKGGVSKTTTTFNLGWMLASTGKTVILVDADPQCNLTGMVLGYGGRTELDQFYEQESGRNIKAGLAPSFESRPSPIVPVECVPVRGRTNLFLLPGHIGLSEYEVTLGIAQELSGTIQTLQNLPGSLSRLLEITAEHHRADYVLIDMNPSLSSINQNLLMTSHYFLVPASPDYFSVMAVDGLASILPRWRAWALAAEGLPALRRASYPFPNVVPKFLGTIVQKYRPRGGAPARGFQTWIDKINDTVSRRLVPALRQSGMTLDDAVYTRYDIYPSLCLATIPDFNALIAYSQESQTPVFALTRRQIKQVGVVLEGTLQQRDNLKEIFEQLTTKIIGLTGNEAGT
jgi:cellulose biosynthesis protein BcsQ